MKLHLLIIRLIALWVPVLPPTPLIAQAQRAASPVEDPVHLVVIAEVPRGANVSKD
jgi:hypothetical protein